MWLALALTLSAAPTPAQLDARFAEIARAQQMPAATAAVVIDDQIYWMQATGTRGDEANTPVKVNDLFRLGSITKTFTALAILQLRDAEKLGLNDEIEKWLPEAQIRPAAWGDRAPTLKDLLLHRSGLPRDAHFDNPRERTQSEAHMALQLNVKLDQAPGAKEVYSNLGYAVLGLVVQRAGDKPYHELMAERLLKPMGMSTIWDDADVPADRRVYGRGRPDKDSPWMVHTGDAPASQMGGAGALCASAPELAQLVKLELGTLRESPVARATVLESQQPDETNTGYGVSMYDVRDEGKVVWKNGLVPGFTASMMVDTARHVGVVLLVAANGTDTDGAAADLLRAAEGK